MQKGTVYKSSAVAEMGDRFATTGMGRNWGGATVGAGSPLGPHLTQCGLDRGLHLYQVATNRLATSVGMQDACTELLLDTNSNQVNSVLELSWTHSKFREIYTLISPL